MSYGLFDLRRPAAFGRLGEFNNRCAGGPVARLFASIYSHRPSRPSWPTCGDQDLTRSESLAYEFGTFGVRVMIVEPGLAPSTGFAANSNGCRDEFMPAACSAYAGRYLKSLQDYPTSYTREGDVAEAVYAAATDDGERLRYPAFMARMRALTSNAEPQQNCVRTILV